MKDILIKDMEIQWKDHFHMRDQTWKTLQYTIIFFLGAIGLEMKEGIEQYITILAYSAVCITSTLGVIVALHHRNRQKLKFSIIKKYEKELGIFALVEDILKEHESGVFNKVNTSSYIVVAQAGLFVVSLSILITKCTS
jgi:hypothetical protein